MLVRTLQKVQSPGLNCYKMVTKLPKTVAFRALMYYTENKYKEIEKHWVLNSANMEVKNTKI